MTMKKTLCLGLALVLIMMLAACAGPGPETTAPVETEAPTQPQAETEVATQPPVETAPEIIENPVENPITYFSMSLGEDYENIRSLVVYEDQGKAYLEYVGEEKKVGRFGLSLLHRLTEQVETAGLHGLDGRAEYAEGLALGSLYISYADGTCLSADFGGVIPGEFTDAYQSMDAWFAEWTAELPVYVPQPVVLDAMDAALQDEMMAILNASGIRELDMLAIGSIPMDEYFSFTAGLSSGEGIVTAAQCSALMMTTPYSFVIVAVEDEGMVQTVREDFRDSMDWHKWVCVMPTDALIAQKGNLVLCLMGAETIYDLTAAGIANSGWTEIETFTSAGH